MSEDPAPERQSIDEVFGPVRGLIARLTRSSALERGDLHTALAQLTEAAAQALNVERTSVWQFNADLSQLYCLDLYERTAHEHSAGEALFGEARPRYFHALGEERTIAAHDARSDPRTSEFTTDYLIRCGISSMLDAPILLDGKLAGVVCHEHVGAMRTWKPWEELVAGTFADFAAMVLGAAERARQSQALEAYRHGLEQLVEQRTVELRRSEENFRRMFAAAPVGLVLSRVADRQLVAGNRVAAELFGLSVDEVPGQYAPDYWVNAAERERLVEEVRSQGTVDRFEAELRKANGETFWADIAVRMLEGEDAPDLLFGIRDITAQRQAAKALRQSRETLRTLFDAAPVPLVLTGLDDAVLRYCNQRAAHMFETTVEEVVGRRAPDFYHDQSDRRAFLGRLAQDGRVDGFVTQLRTLTGRTFWAQLNARTLSLENERVFMVGFVDLTEHKRVESQLRELATTDSLTGALTRRRLFEVAEEEIERASRYARPLALAMLDVDHFKAVNDGFGHMVGDEALKGVTQAVRSALRRQDHVGRYGGEELVVVLPETTLDSARHVVERMRAAVEQLVLDCGEGSVRLTVSAGVVAYRGPESLSALLRRADTALYDAKAAGRNCVVANG